MIFARIIAIGRVQGVFYRAFARDTARQMGIAGYARNLPDGDKVEIVCECKDEKQLGEFIKALDVREDMGIYVREIRIAEKKKINIGSYTGFEIRYY